MDRLTSRFPESINALHELQNHDNFVINGQKIFPELVECAEHFVLACQNNPGFTSKIINTEYDLLIGDDVSGRPITLMIKNIIDYFRKAKNIKGGIDNIFIDNPYLIGKSITNKIIKKYGNKKILYSTECMMSGQTMDSTISKFFIRGDLIDIFSQSIDDVNYVKESSSMNYANIYQGNTAAYNKIYLSQTKYKYIGLYSSFSKNSLI